MANRSSSTIYDSVVKVTHVYLGPAADRFIARQIENHLKKRPQNISASDLVELIDWLRISISMLTEDKEIVEEYTRELYKLADKTDTAARRFS
jgi:uncharacterized protein YlxP (DUF503 family)